MNKYANCKLIIQKAVVKILEYHRIFFFIKIQFQVFIDPLPAHIVLGQLQRLCRELLSFVPLITVSQVFSKLLWGQTKLLGKTI